MNELNKSDVLAHSTLGADLEPAEREVLAERMGVESLTSGAILVREGDDRRTLFILAEGRLSVGKTHGDHEDIVYQMRPGECSGTRAFVDGSARKAALRADGDTHILTLEPDDFDTLIESHPRLVFKVMRAIFRITHSNLMRVNLETAEMRKYLTKTGGRY